MGTWKITLRIAMVVAIVLPALVGCSETTVTGQNTGKLAMSIQVLGGSGRYDTARLRITEVKYRPVDPDVQASLSGTDFGLVTAPLDLNLSNPGVLQVLVGLPASTTQFITAGEYEVYQARVVEFSLIDESPLNPGTTCVQQVSALAKPPNATQGLSNGVFEFDPPERFTIQDDKTTQLLLTVDGPGLIGLLETRFACNLPPNACPGVSEPPPCIWAFADPAPGVIEPFFSIELQP